MSHAKTLLKLSAVAAAILSGHSAWAQTACNGGTFPPCLNPTATDSAGNTAGGTNALHSNVSGYFNTAFGFDALTSVNGNGSGTFGSPGGGNSAFGYVALSQNTTGTFNNAFGGAALQSNTSGAGNNAFGYYALLSNTKGNGNSAFGHQALQYNSFGNNNTAVGEGALLFNGTNYFVPVTDDGVVSRNNTAIGVQAMYLFSTGSSNVAIGNSALYGAKFNSAGVPVATGTGSFNVMVGDSAGGSMLSGSNNNGLGNAALSAVTSGSSNIAIGFQAGNTLTTESNNVDIANLGVAGDVGVVRIGTAGTQSAVYLAGVDGVTPKGRLAEVVIGADGQIGTRHSSRRYKKDIEDLGDQSSRLSELRPVTFRYKADPGERQYGLIAEEVDKVYPDLVIRGKDGEIESVDYDALVPMLLNELQKQQKEIAALKSQSDDLATLKAALAEQSLRLAQVEAQARAAASLASR